MELLRSIMGLKIVHSPPRHDKKAQPPQRACREAIKRNAYATFVPANPQLSIVEVNALRIFSNLSDCQANVLAAKHWT